MTKCRNRLGLLDASDLPHTTRLVDRGAHDYRRGETTMTETRQTATIEERILDLDAAERLKTEPLSKVLRDVTWGSHERAEFGEFEQALIHGKLRREVYAVLLAQSYVVYSAIEEEAERLADDPIASQVIFPEVHRAEAVALDLEFYLGSNWRDELEILPITAAYVERIHAAAAEGPAGYIAHNYTRYLADLSGGFVIDKAITGAYSLEVDGRRLYIFDGIDQPTAFKQTYRGILDTLDLTFEQKTKLIEEALIAYEFNIKLNETICEAYAPVTIDA
jgi:heme oxygenase